MCCPLETYPWTVTMLHLMSSLSLAALACSGATAPSTPSSLAEEAGRFAALLPSTFARPLISDHESPTHPVGPDGTLSVQGVAGPGARGHWRDGYNVVGAGDSEALGEASSTVGGYLALGALRRRARAMAGDAGRALRTLAAAVADGVGRAMTAVEGLRDGRRGGRVRWRPRFGDG